MAGDSAEVAVLKSEVATLTSSVEKLTRQVQALNDEWNKANGVLSFMKWLAGLAAGAGLFAVIFKDHLGGK
jgi:hypothetical protein